MGSSPHTRGARLSHAQHLLWGGIIPAYAGSTRHSFCHRCPIWDHPRIRGEHGIGSPHPAHLQGSSPHTRGARWLGDWLADAGRIIPAYAGSTAWTWPSTRASPDHPRIRGEHERRNQGRGDENGSSPHTRGALGVFHYRVLSVGIIPAYAGSTRTYRPRRGKRSDHPRIRGEHYPRHVGERAQKGSSPHTRGALGAGGAPARVPGIIPAYAGSTLFEDELIENERDHPRIRGEHDSRAA